MNLYIVYAGELIHTLRDFTGPVPAIGDHILIGENRHYSITERLFMFDVEGTTLLSIRLVVK